MRFARRAALSLIVLPLLAIAAACADSHRCPDCTDIIAGVPFASGESLNYQLQQNGEDKADFQTTVTRDGDHLVLKQISKDDEGNSDTTAVTVDAQTLKPALLLGADNQPIPSATRDVIDSEQRTLLESTYASVDTDTCDTGTQVTVKKSVFQPPDDATPDSERSVPKCLPEFAYDNDTSLFIWRAIKFEEGYTVTYRTWLTNQQEQQIVTLTVKGQQRVTTPAGDFDSWYVEIAADETTQQAWFATTDDHRMLRYNNGNVTFLLKE
jgi:hypothetical protein